MKMRKLAMALGLVGALVALPATGATGAVGGTDRPFDGSGKARLIITDAQAGTFVIRGRAIVNHLGVVKVRGEGTISGNNLSFTSKLVAANGDKLKTASTGTFAADGTFVNSDTVTGGTGRFVGASGQSTTTGTWKPKKTDPSITRLVFSFTGTVNY
jgi:hypothetical protein